MVRQQECNVAAGSRSHRCEKDEWERLPAAISAERGKESFQITVALKPPSGPRLFNQLNQPINHLTKLEKLS
jgi:hypothetical protein